MKRVVLHTGTISEVKAATRDDHLFVPLADLRVWALKHKATVEKMPHASSCLALFCSRCLTPVDSMKHQFEPNECNCPRGDALREIEELL